ncbi:HAMP domain-containing sensor histidine kinase [Agromyces sp. Root81]|uniref:sensor histidine kinase n=1 Tax=Agromyces sp. Root81 TaxID=1736601 RepID=UPI0026F41C01|nr:HAMP domain-containing sensor histidine kinase [Agromyces sp. Root81]
MSVRAKFTLSYAGFLLVAGILIISVVWLFLLRERSSLYLPPLEDFLLILSPRNFGPRVFSPAAIALLLLLLVIGLVGGWILAGRMLAPLTRITTAARRASRGSLAHRVEMEGHQDEFRELADTFDTMLAQLESQVAEQQRFAANASHELRTPLAVMQTMLDVALQDPSSDGREERLRAVNARAIALTEALLLLSRADQRSFTPEEVDLSFAAEEAAEILLPLAEKLHVSLELAGGPAVTRGSRTLLPQMVTNLVQNAIVHNLAENGTVQIMTTAGTEAVVLSIENTGELLSAEGVSTLTEPFQRGTERIHSDQAGLGLGLAIVQRIVRAHDGTLNLSARDAGGLRVTVKLPAP